MSNGSRANRTGQTQENFIEGYIVDVGYTKVPSKDFFDQIPSQKPIYARQCYAGETIYHQRRRVDFILYHPEKWRDCLVIQSKWQASTGSVHEKYPYEVMSIEANPYPTIIVLDGGGYPDYAETWLKSQAGQGKLIEVLNQGGFARFASRGKL